MDLKAAIKDLSDKLGPPKARAAFGTWTAYAWLVRGLVEQGHGVTDAVNHVLENSGVKCSKSSFGSVRAAYYKIKEQEWPAEFANATTGETKEEGFE